MKRAPRTGYENADEIIIIDDDSIGSTETDDGDCAIHESIVKLLIDIENTASIDVEIYETFLLLWNRSYADETNDFELTVAANLFKKILHRWPGWKTDRKRRSDVSARATDLRTHLTEHLNYIHDHLGEQIKRVICDNVEIDKITVHCSPKMLKMFFNNEPAKCGSYYNTIVPPSFTHEAIIPKSLVNWPYITVKLWFPGFEMIHENSSTHEFKIVNLNKFKGLEELLSQNVITDYKTASYESPIKLVDSISTATLLKYVHRLKHSLGEESSILTKTKHQLYKVLYEIENDILLCGKHILIGTRYNKVLSKNPYIRYLGRPLHKNSPHITVADQLKIKDDTGLNIRLLQINYPSLSFIFKNLDILNTIKGTSGSWSHIHDSFKKYSLIYECSLCTLCFDSTHSQYEIVHHLNDSHGIEPDWLCPKCNVSFSTEHLSLSRWNHLCM